MNNKSFGKIKNALSKILLWLFYKQNNLNEYLFAGEILRKVSSNTYLVSILENPSLEAPKTSKTMRLWRILNQEVMTFKTMASIYLYCVKWYPH